MKIDSRASNPFGSVLTLQQHLFSENSCNRLKIVVHSKSHMTNQYQPPLNPTASMYGGAAAGAGNHAQTKNPYFTVGSQFLPRNLQDVIRWARYIAIKSPVTTEVIRKLSTYPITSFTYKADGAALKSKYDEIIKSFRLRQTLHDVGFQYHTVGNVFISMYYPILRTFSCKECKSVYGANKAEFLKWESWVFKGECPNCKARGEFIRKDVKSTDISQMNVIRWDPINIVVNHNPISGKSEYFYQIPNEIKRKILTGDRLFLSSIPWEFVEAVKAGQDFKFAENELFHLKNVDLGLSVNGVSVPPLITHFDLVFYQATLRKANESIATDFMAPLRVVFPQAQTGNSDPVVSISMRNFAANMEQAFVKHKADNNHVLVAPLPIGYQAISGEGKTLLVNAEIAQAEESLLLSMGVSRELLSGTSNWNSSTVGLRMLRNTLDSYVTQIEELLEWIFSKTSAYLNISYTKVGLVPFQLTDDEALKAMITALIPTGKVSMSTIFEALGRDYEEEQTRLRDDAVSEAANAVKTQWETDQAVFLAGQEINDINKKDDSYQAALGQAQQMAEELMNMDPNTQRQVLNQLKMTDFSKYLLTAKLLEEGAQMMNQPDMPAPMGAAPGGAGGAPGPAGAEAPPPQPGQGVDGPSSGGPVGPRTDVPEPGIMMGPMSSPYIPGLRSPPRGPTQRPPVDPNSGKPLDKPGQSKTQSKPSDKKDKK